MLVDHVTTYTVGRPYVVFRAKVGKCAAKVIQQAFVLIGNRNADGTSLPNSHQPHCVESDRGDNIPLGGRHRKQIDCYSIPLANVRKPDPSIDLVDGRVSGPDGNAMECRSRCSKGCTHTDSLLVETSKRPTARYSNLCPYRPLLRERRHILVLLVSEVMLRQSPLPALTARVFSPRCSVVNCRFCQYSVQG